MHHTMNRPSPTTSLGTRAAGDVQSPAEGGATFAVPGSSYDSFMGRYSAPLAERFAERAGVRQGERAVDIGCGPGALTNVLARRLGPAAVHACDPSPPFVAACAARHPAVRVEVAAAESLPFDSDSFDHAMAQLVLRFVADPIVAAQEMMRVTVRGGTVSACMWDADGGMEMLSHYWDAVCALGVERLTPPASTRFGRPGEIAELFVTVGMCDVVDSTLEVSSTYASFDELWFGYRQGVGTVGASCAALTDAERDRLRNELFRSVGAPSGSFTLAGVAHCAVARVP